LKERVNQLDQENTALSEVSSTTKDEENLSDITRIVERINKLKSQLRQANTTAHHPVNIEG